MGYQCDRTNQLKAEMVFGDESSFALQMWVKPTHSYPDPDTYVCMFDMVNANSHFVAFAPRQSPTVLKGFTRRDNRGSGSSYGTGEPTGYVADTWIHYLCQYDVSTGTMTGYENGVQFGSFTNANGGWWGNHIMEMRIGEMLTSWHPNTGDWGVAEVAMWRLGSMMAASEIAALAGGDTPRAVRGRELWFYEPLRDSYGIEWSTDGTEQWIDHPTMNAETDSFDPATDSSLQVWLDGSDSSTMTIVNTDEVDEWHNKVAGSTEYYALYADMYGNTQTRPNFDGEGVRFDGVSDSLYGHGDLSWRGIANNNDFAPGAVFVVFDSYGGNDNTAPIYGAHRHEGNNAYGTGFRTYGNYHRRLVGMARTNSDGPFFEHPMEFGRQIAALVWNEDSSCIRLNGKLMEQGVAPNLNHTYNRTLGTMYGGGNGGYKHWDGRLCEVLHFDDTFDSYDLNLIEQIEGYLANKWGLDGRLPTGHRGSQPYQVSCVEKPSREMNYWLNGGHSLSQGLVGAYLFNDGQGTVVTDELGLHHGTFENTSLRSGWVNRSGRISLEFRSTGYHVLLGTDDWWPLTNTTLVFGRRKLDTSAPFSTAFGNMHPANLGNARRFQSHMGWGQTTYFDFGGVNNSNGERYQDPTPGRHINIEWWRMAHSAGSDGTKIFENGDVLYSNPGQITRTQGDQCIVNGGGGRDGYLCEWDFLYVYDRQLSDLEVEDLHANPWQIWSTAVGNGLMDRRRQIILGGA